MSTSQPPRAPHAAADAGGTPDARQLRAILIAVSLALMAVIASVSGLNVAQTHLAVEWGASQSTVLWIINIYTLALAALLLPLGAIGDRLGRKPMLITGLVVFGAAAVVAGLAPSPAVMLGARAVAGVGAAMIMPITLAVITSTFPEEKRGRAIGVWTGVAGGGGILGMFLSALLVDVADWRWLFVLPVALVAAALAMTLRSVPNSREHATRSFDTVGALFSAVAVVGLIFVLQEGPERGWTDPVSLTGLAVGVGAAVAFVAWELRRRDAALLDVRLFRERGLTGGSVTLLVVFGVQAGIAVVLFPFFQAVLGWSGLLSTAAMMPMAVMMMVASGLAPKLAVTIGARATMAVGVALAALGLALMALFVSVDGGYLSVLAGMLAMGVGMGLSMTPSTEAITGSLPRAKQGVASALNDVTRELGTALGVALLGALLASGYRGAIDDRLDGIPASAADTAREGIANAVEVAPETGGHAHALIRAAQQSFVDGWQQALWIGAAVLAALLVHVVLRGPADRTPAEADEGATARAGTAPSAAAR
ncbi:MULTISPECIES: DHA2 family efflux MFS transporter permease subunit [unclassified Streptomyces]|uniref:DHA2 family efflux MFS transporter permease subunit n=1 Tax=unclassified Streptomyces TaxID=2593676 RepID=UPI000DB944AB|nr:MULTISPECIES: DHA2 family efflux MFS transporter permease subunit [unclassified Streptomyces]MYT71558.1 DHA2 family efflux MFS transporter permease subunit [Streptomyces sp. SID8367]RAJ83021.1 EmrB/QacA subfamily drug resistance transporter [Streptomyces sp. PsTaAH-137]